jgi:hypothetical protein
MIKMWCGSEFYNFPYWWLFPLAMIILCFLVMRGRWGSMMCGFGPRRTDNHKNKEEYEEKRSVLRQVPETEKVNSELGV